jgi:hypothetical protein
MAKVKRLALYGILEYVNKCQFARLGRLEQRERNGCSDPACCTYNANFHFLALITLASAP